MNKLTISLLIGGFLCSGVAVGDEDSQGLRREVWQGIDGGGLWSLRNSEKFHAEPDLIEILDGAVAPQDIGDRYGQRLRGFLIPQVTGRYTFWIASDDNCELSLSSDDNKFNKRRIAGISGMGWGHRTDYVGFQEWDRFPNQKSMEIELEAGRKYFIEALHKENRGKDHLSIAWSGPVGEKPQIIPSARLTPYIEDDLDLDQDDLPDSWEQTHQLTDVSSAEKIAMNGPLGDPDGDGWLNWEECENGSDPNKAESREGCLTQEIWYGLVGDSTEHLYGLDQFHLPPDRRGLVQGASVSEFPGDDQFGMRLRGFITAPESGEYRFWISGDDHCDLYLSDGESRFNIEKMAWVKGDQENGHSTKRGEWDKFASQESRLIELEAGKRYYLEVLHKEGWWDGHVALAWARPGQDKREEIPAAVLSSYLPSEEDPDDDGLPTEWEEAHGFDPASRDGKDGPLGDPDGDLLPNWFEYSFEQDPNTFENLQGGFSEEIWREIYGHFVRELVESPRFLEGPNYAGLRFGAMALAERGDHYGIRLRATFEAPSSGAYTFWVASDNHSELWISDNETKFDKNLVAWLRGPGNGSDGDYTFRENWDHYPSQKSRTIVLEEGKSYFIEALLKEGWGGDHIQVAWQAPDGEREILPATALTSFLRDDNDGDDDYLPDDWELEFGLAVNDNGSENFLLEGERGDFDQDGLSNWREYRLGTNPANSDSDGDGVSDFVEVNDYKSNPNFRDVLPPSLYREIDLTDRVAETEGWEDLDGLVTSGRRGEVTFEVSISEAGVYFAELVAEVIHPEVRTLPIRFLINDQHVATRKLIGRWTEEHALSVRLPWLPAGNHELTIDSENFEKGIRLRIASLQLLKPEGNDDNTNGMADWMEGLLSNENTAITPRSSQSSPVCLEGSATWVGNVVIDGSTGGAVAKAGINGSWFADIPLAESGNTQIDVSFEGGAVTATQMTEWIVTNVLTQPTTLGLRSGDSLKLSAIPEGGTAGENEFQLSINGAVTHTGPANSPFIHRFDAPGEYLITASSQGVQGSFAVQVYAADFGGPFHLAGGQNRVWDLSAVPHPLYLEWDEEIRATQAESEPDERIYIVGYPHLAQTVKHVIARLPGGGPIVARGTVKAFLFANAVYSGDHRVVEVLEDGTRVIEVGFVLDGPVPDDFSVFLSMWVPDAVFADGESTLNLTAADFDENGLAKFEILKAPGGDTENAICHAIELFEGENALKQ